MISQSRNIIDLLIKYTDLPPSDC